ncbi:MAG: hypothetical protein HC866_13200 [Leptolyngbyaceae cyanobacterium RU_5_1]|nr:hypothetical protein [Leptolyngbyaceae cyanobacterium RU_5_1]
MTGEKHRRLQRFTLSMIQTGSGFRTMYSTNGGANLKQFCTAQPVVKRIHQICLSLHQFGVPIDLPTAPPLIRGAGGIGAKDV